MGKPRRGDLAHIRSSDPRHGKDVLKAFIRSDTVAHLTGTVEPGDRLMVLDETLEGTQVYMKVLVKDGTWWIHSAFLETDED